SGVAVAVVAPLLRSRTDTANEIRCTWAGAAAGVAWSATTRGAGSAFAAGPVVASVPLGDAGADAAAAPTSGALLDVGAGRAAAAAEAGALAGAAGAGAFPPLALGAGVGVGGSSTSMRRL